MRFDPRQRAAPIAPCARSGFGDTSRWDHRVPTSPSQKPQGRKALSHKEAMTQSLRPANSQKIRAHHPRGQTGPNPTLLQKRLRTGHRVSRIEIGATGREVKIQSVRVKRVESAKVGILRCPNPSGEKAERTANDGNGTLAFFHRNLKGRVPSP